MPKKTIEILKIKGIEIESFRGIRDAEISLHPKITILIGKNGAGKTTVLDAIALGLIAFQRAWEANTAEFQSVRTMHGVRIENDEIRMPAKQAEINLDMSYPISSFFDDDVFRISVLSNRSKSNSELSNLVRSLDTVSQNFKKPLFVYYRQDRTFEGKLRRSRSANIHQDELEGDLRAISDLENWWDNRDAEEARAVRDTGNTNFRDPQLQAIRALIQKIDAFEDVRYSYDASRPGLYFSKTDGQRVHISKLSGGERSYIILLADLARRLQISQPDIDLADIPGIILIDEIELNLHPSWQSEVIITLCEVFKSCQFVVSTHSPQVISAVESEKVRILKAVRDGIIEVDRPLSTHGRSSNYLLEGVFGASERLPKVDQMINNFNTSIEIRNLDGAERMLEEISKEIEGSATELLVLKKRLKKLKGLK